MIKNHLLRILYLFLLVLVLVLLYLGFNRHVSDSTKQVDSKKSDTMKQEIDSKVSCRFADENTPKKLQFLQDITLGNSPRSILLPSEYDKKTLVPNSHPEDIRQYVRSASGVTFIEGGSYSESNNFEFLIVQDSLSKIARVSFSNNLNDVYFKQQELKMRGLMQLRTISQKEEELFESPNRDYESFRKNNKKDFESILSLEDGTYLALSSASDFSKKGNLSRRNSAVIFDSKSNSAQEYNIYYFFEMLRLNKNFVGIPGINGRIEINIEGMSLRKHMGEQLISFFQRSNMSENRQNALIEFSLKEWLFLLKSGVFSKAFDPTLLKIHRIVTFDFGSVLLADTDKTFDLSLGSVLLGQSAGETDYLVAVGVEADNFDKRGNHLDGDVIFSGLVLWRNINKTEDADCVIYQAPGDNKPGLKSLFGKIEGLAAYNPKASHIDWRFKYSDEALIFAVVDKDSELSVSSLKLLNFISTNK